VSKVQIVTKALLATLGLGAALRLCAYASAAIRARPDASTAQVLFFLTVLIALVVLIGYFLVLRNDWLACKIAGGGDELPPEEEVFWLSGCFRLAGICYGLILLCYSVPTILNMVVSPLYIRPLINEIFRFKTFPKSLIFSAAQWSSMTYNVLKAILAVYLLCGWPQFVRRQLKLRQKAGLAKTDT
jgi:hypothetical protein